MENQATGDQHSRYIKCTSYCEVINIILKNYVPKAHIRC